MGGRGSSGGKYAYESVDSLQRKLSAAQQKLNKALQDRSVFGGLTNKSVPDRLQRRARTNVTRANKTIANAESEIKELQSAIERAKRRRRTVPF